MPYPERKPLNISKPMNKRNKYFNELKNNYYVENGIEFGLTYGDREMRTGYIAGVSDYHNSVKQSLGIGPKERLPAGKGIDVGLFEIKKK